MARDPVFLQGGPMANTLVNADAPALSPDFFDNWSQFRAAMQLPPPEIAPGRYELVGDDRAEWRELDPE